jgi:hypothetical protein
MSRYQYETDDETGIYIEDDPNYEEPIVKDDDHNIMDENMIAVPHEDPINDNCNAQDKLKGNVNVNESGQPPTSPDCKVKLSKFIKKWGVCWMVLFIVALAITGTVFMFRNFLSKANNHGSSNTSSSSNNENNIDVRATTTSPSSTPSAVPSILPTSYPSVSPAVQDVVDKPNTNPVPVPVVVPTNVPSTTTPTITPTTMTPSSNPSTILYSQIISILRSASTTPEQFNDRLSYESQAAHWVKDNSTIDLSNNHDKIIQRYTIALLDISLHTKFTLALPSIDECEWVGVTCENEVDATTTTIDHANTATTKNMLSYSPVTAIVWNDQNMTGQQIPNDISLLSNSIIQFDLSNNRITGTLPYGLYDCTALQYLYIFRNQISGTIGTEIGQLSSLQKVLFSTNQLSGSIPSGLGISSLGTFLYLYINDVIFLYL